MSGGLTYGSVKDQIALVTENGICPDDPRVLTRTNEAIGSILQEILPVGGAMTVDVQATGTNGDEIWLPKELDNVIEVEVIGSTVNGQSDVTQGWIVNQFAYSNPDSAHDNPLIDLFLQPDESNASILRRKYRYPGLEPNATVRVTGAKRYIPITMDSDYLIVQNVLAIKEMIQSIERAENNDLQGAEIFHKRCIDRLMAEVKKHQLDPSNSLKRKANYDADLINYPQGTFGWVRARLAFELPGALNMGKSELTRIIEQAEMSLIDAGHWVGTLQEYEATLNDPDILAPKEVLTIVAIDLCGRGLSIKNLLFNYNQHGANWCPCIPELRDQGEIVDSNGDHRRQYKLVGSGASTTQSRTITFVGALRWVKKNPNDRLVIQNFNAMKLAAQAQMHQKIEKWDDAAKSMSLAVSELDRELGKYLSGQTIVAPVNLHGGYTRHGVL